MDADQCYTSVTEEAAAWQEMKCAMFADRELARGRSLDGMLLGFAVNSPLAEAIVKTWRESVPADRQEFVLMPKARPVVLCYAGPLRTYTIVERPGLIRMFEAITPENLQLLVSELLLDVPGKRG